MPKYYFDLHEHDRVTLDEGGAHLPDIDAARRAAIECLGEIIRSFPYEGNERIRIAVRNDERSYVLDASATLQIEKLGPIG